MFANTAINTNVHFVLYLKILGIVYRNGKIISVLKFNFKNLIFCLYICIIILVRNNAVGITYVVLYIPKSWGIIWMLCILEVHIHGLHLKAYYHVIQTSLYLLHLYTWKYSLCHMIEWIHGEWRSFVFWIYRMDEKCLYFGNLTSYKYFCLLPDQQLYFSCFKGDIILNFLNQLFYIASYIDTELWYKAYKW
jgi:hypothetical protein